MTINGVDKMWSRSSGDATFSDKFRRLDANFEEAYQVLHTVGETRVNILNAEKDGNRIPYAGEPYPGFPFVVAVSASVETVSPILSIVSIKYSGEIGRSNRTGDQPSPLFAPPKIDWDDVETEEEVDEDFDGNPIVTANFEPLTGIKRPIADQTVTIRRNFLLFNSYVQARYRQAVNSDTFLGWPPGTARIIKFSASNVLDSNLGYWEVTATIQLRYPYKTTPDKAWYKRVLHQGFYERVGTAPNERIVRATDGDQMPVNKPVLLDENGVKIPDGGTPYYKEFKIFDSLPFNALGLLNP